jgi:hypothetical protein
VLQRRTSDNEDTDKFEWESEEEEEEASFNAAGAGSSALASRNIAPGPPTMVRQLANRYVSNNACTHH